MAKINLLPWREARREQLKQQFFANLGVSVIGAALLAGLVYLLINASITNQNNRNAYIQRHIDQLNKDVAEIADERALFHAVGTEGNGVANSKPQQRHQTGERKTLHQYRQYVLGAYQATVEQRQTGNSHE